MSDAVLLDKTQITALQAATAKLQQDQAAAVVARQASLDATATVRASADLQRAAYNNLAAQVQMDSDGDEAFILSTGFGVRSSGTPTPPLVYAPADVATAINGVPGRVGLSWSGVSGARNYEAQHTTDLTGASGWVSATETPGKTQIKIDDLTSGTRYAFRVRALGNAQPGPWSGPVQQMVA